MLRVRVIGSALNSVPSLQSVQGCFADHTHSRQAATGSGQMQLIGAEPRGGGCFIFMGVIISAIPAIPAVPAVSHRPKSHRDSR